MARLPHFERGGLSAYLLSKIVGDGWHWQGGDLRQSDGRWRLSPGQMPATAWPRCQYCAWVMPMLTGTARCGVTRGR